MKDRHEWNEDLKDFGWSVYHSDLGQMPVKAAGLLMVMYGHYDRSRWSFEKNKDTTHPDMKEYIKHWLSANGHNWDKSAVDYLKCHFGVAEVARMAKGKSYIELNKGNL